MQTHKASVEGKRQASTRAAPTNTTQPAAAGDATVGAQLKCTMGEWTGEPTEYAYDWQADGQSVGSGDILVVPGDAVGKSVACVVTASNADGSAEATSNAIGPVKARPADSAPDGHTIADEQRARSDIIEKMGVENYKNEVMDQRPPEEQSRERQVPGVAPPTKRS